MTSFIFIWKPKRYHWEHLEEDIKELQESGKVNERWSCGNTKSIEQGDRIYLIKVGTKPKGVIGSGYALTRPFFGRHWNGERRDTLYVDIEFDALLNPEVEEILRIDMLDSANLANNTRGHHKHLAYHSN